MTESGDPPAESEEGGASIELSIPITEPGLFKYGATAPLLNLLVDNPHMKFSMRKIAELTDFSAGSVRNAVGVLEANGVVTVHEEENAKRIQINLSVLDKPEDSILSIPQTKFQIPTKDAVNRLQEELDEVLGVVLFGSVARGTADRRSDIDLWVLVREDANQQQHTANKIVKQLEEARYPETIHYQGQQLIEKSKIYSDLVLEERHEEVLDRPEGGLDDLEIERDELMDLENPILVPTHLNNLDEISGSRYQFEIVVESVKSALAQTGQIDDELFIEGITLVNTEELERVKAEVLGDE